jgi:hypothetical protein
MPEWHRRNTLERLGFRTWIVGRFHNQTNDLPIQPIRVENEERSRRLQQIGHSVSNTFTTHLIALFCQFF